MHKDSYTRKIIVLFLSLVALAIIGAVVFLLPDKKSNIQYEGNDGVQVATDKIVKPYKIVAVGDIACPSDEVVPQATCSSKEVSALVQKLDPDAVMLLGDIQYIKGDLKDFKASFGVDWAPLLPKIYPALGNHEYGNKNADGYFDYFSASNIQTGERDKGYYKTSLTTWDVFVLNSNCEFIGGCTEESEQGRWYKQALNESSKNACTLSIWHHPRFTSGKYVEDTASSARSAYFWAAFTAQKGDVILNGHDHIYERFFAQDGNGLRTESGPRQFTVGTGGFSQNPQFKKNPNQEKIVEKNAGVLEITLYKSSYAWRFVDLKGNDLDSGRANCVE